MNSWNKISSFLLLFLFLSFSCSVHSQSTFFRHYDLGNIQPFNLLLASDPAGHRLMAYYVNQDVGLIKTDAVGNLLWHKTYDTGGDDRVFRVETTDSTYLLVGSTEGTSTDNKDFMLLITDHDGDPLPSYRYDVNDEDDQFKDILPLEDGFLLVGNGGTGLILDGQIIRLDENYQVVWNQTLANNQGVGGTDAVEPTSDGGFIVVGGLNQGQSTGTDVYVLKLDSTGNKEWNALFGSSQMEGAQSVVQTQDGGYIVVGTSFGLDASAFMPQGFLARFSPSGTRQWVKVNSRFNGITNILPTDDGNYIIAGNASGNPIFGAPRHTYEKIDSNGNSHWLRYFGTFYSDDTRYAELQPDGGLLVAGLSFNVDGTQQYQPTLGLVDSLGKVGCTDTTYSSVIFDVTPVTGSVTELISSGIDSYPLSVTATATVGTDSLYCCSQNFDMQFSYSEGFNNQVNFTSAAPWGGLSYNWDFGDNGSSTDPNPSHTYAATGTYTVCLTITSSCGTQTECFPVTVGGVGVPEIGAEKITLFPNPVQDRLQVRIPGQVAPRSLRFLDLQGKERWSKDLSREVSAQSQVYFISMEGIPAGWYLLEIEGRNNRIYRKVVVRKE